MTHPLDHLALPEVSRITGITVDGLRNRIRRGELDAVRVGSRIYIVRRTVDDFMRGQLIAAK